MTLIDVICKGRAFSRGWETPNDRFPLPVAQSLTQFYRKFVVFFLFISDHHLSNKGVEQWEVEQGCCEEPWESAVPPVLRLWMCVNEPMETAGLLHKELQGGCALGTGHRGVIAGNPHCSDSGRLSLTGGCPRAMVGGRLRHTGPCDTRQPLGKPSVCPASRCVKGNSVTVLGKIMLRPWQRQCSVTLAYTVVCTCRPHIKPSLSRLWPQMHRRWIRAKKML